MKKCNYFAGWFATVFAACLTSPAAAINGTPSWVFSTITPDPGPDSYISSPDLAFDHYGNAAVTWSRNDTLGFGTNYVYHSELTPLSIWSTRELVSANGVGLLTALSYDRSERPHLAWINNDGHIGADFNYQTPVNLSPTPLANTASPSLSLRHDLAGNLRGVYSAASAGQFGSLSWNGSNYSTASLTTLSFINSTDSAVLATDSRGLRQLIVDARVQPSNSPAVVLASEPSNSSTWTSSILLTADNVSGVDLTANPFNNHLGFVYAVQQGANARLYYAESNGNVLTTTLLVDSPSVTLGDVSLAFDASDGTPGIAYEELNSARLMFAYRNGQGVWTTGVVDSSISTAGPFGARRAPSLAYNDYGTGFPAIAYVDADGSLRVAFDPISSVPEPATMSLLALAAFVAFPRRRGHMGRRA